MHNTNLISEERVEMQDAVNCIFARIVLVSNVDKQLEEILD